MNCFERAIMEDAVACNITAFCNWRRGITMETILEVKGVTKKIKNRKILDNVTLHIDSGEIVGLVGPNGAGKTSLMKLIAGYNFPTVGTIEICGHDVGREHAAAMREAAFLVENPGLYPELSGRQHIHMVCDSRGIDRSSIEDLTDFLDFPKQLDDRVKTYSIGMKQRLGLAMCWAVQPKLLVLDEPLNGLDPDGIFLLRKRVEEAAVQGTAILISSHLLSELEKTATRFLFLRQGKIIGEESVNTVFPKGLSAEISLTEDAASESSDGLEERYRELFGRR